MRGLSIPGRRSQYAQGFYRPIQPPDPALFYWANQGDASFDVERGSLRIRAPGNAGNLFRLLQKPYMGVGRVAIMDFVFDGLNNNFASAGIALYDGAKASVLVLSQNGNVLQQTYNNITGGGFNGQNVGVFIPGAVCSFAVSDDGAGGRSWYVSNDGRSFVGLFGETTNSWLTPTGIGPIVGPPTSAIAVRLDVLSWREMPWTEFSPSI